MYRIPEIAKHFGVVTATARRWFEEPPVKGQSPRPIPGVIPIPAGSQRPRYHVPPEVADKRFREMKLPEEWIADLALKHANGNSHKNGLTPKSKKVKDTKTINKYRKARA